jgi:hypothetical protein
MAAGLIKQAAGLSADILSEHERRLETAAGAVGQLSGAVLRHAQSIAEVKTQLVEVADMRKEIDFLRRMVAELAARSGMAAHFAESLLGGGVIVEGEYTHG